MSINLVSGYAGEPHVTSADVASLWASIVGEEDYVFDHGHNFSCSMISTNVARIFGGDALLQGKHVRQADSEYTDVSIDNGTSGMYRKDLIVLRWTKDSSTSVESCALAVVKGTEAATAAAAVEPSPTQEWQYSCQYENRRNGTVAFRDVFGRTQAVSLGSPDSISAVITIN